MVYVLAEWTVAHKQGQRHAPSLLYALERRRGVVNPRQELKTEDPDLHHDLMID